MWNLTQAFNCRPSDLEAEDLGEMLAAIDAGNTYRVALKMRNGEKLAPEEDKLAGEVLSYKEVPSMVGEDRDFDKLLKEV